MRHYIAVALLLVLSACSGDDDAPAFDSTLPGVDNSTGTRLRLIEFARDDRSWEERYDYDAAGHLIRVVDTRGLGLRYDIARADDGEVVAVATFRHDEERLVRTDSFAYDADGRLGEVRHYDADYFTDTLALSYTNTYDYDVGGRLAESIRRPARSPSSPSRSVYTWEDSNITHVEHYRGEALRHESFFSYDRRANYQRAQPHHIGRLSYWSANNVVESGFIDYTGIIDAICNPCRTRYRYNLDGYPTAVEEAWGERLMLRYE